MMDGSNIVSDITAKAGILIASFLGSLLSLKWIDPGRTWPAKMAMVFGGFVISVYVTPILTSWLSASDKLDRGYSFALGLFGMSLVDAVYGQIKSGALTAAIKQKLGIT